MRAPRRGVSFDTGGTLYHLHDILPAAPFPRDRKAITDATLDRELGCVARGQGFRGRARHARGKQQHKMQHQGCANGSRAGIL